MAPAVPSDRMESTSTGTTTAIASGVGRGVMALDVLSARRGSIGTESGTSAFGAGRRAPARAVPSVRRGGTRGSQYAVTHWCGGDACPRRPDKQPKTKEETDMKNEKKAGTCKTVHLGAKRVPMAFHVPPLRGLGGLCARWFSRGRDKRVPPNTDTRLEGAFPHDKRGPRRDGGYCMFSSRQ